MMIPMAPIQVFKEKDEKNSFLDSQNFTIWSKVYDISQKLNNPISDKDVVLNNIITLKYQQHEPNG